MARVKQWWRVASPAGSVEVDSEELTVAMTDPIVDATLLRTRMFVSLATERPNLPPFYPGNANTPHGFRLVAVTPDVSFPDGWQNDHSTYDDVIFHPLIWDSGQYVPPDSPPTRPEHYFANAYPAGGLADSAAMRHVPGDHVFSFKVWIGPLLTGVSGADPLFTVQFWISALIEATV
jgi:hypothetical protein